MAKAAKRWRFEQLRCTFPVAQNILLRVSVLTRHATLQGWTIWATDLSEGALALDSLQAVQVCLRVNECASMYCWWAEAAIP